MNALTVFLFYFGVFVVVVGVHEAGHYLAGWVAGIPPGKMRIRTWAFPQHVALRDEDGWVSRDRIDEYIAAVWRYLPRRPQVFLYVAGGFALETLFTVTATLALNAAGFSKIAWVVLMLSTFGVVWWLVLDALRTLRGRICGDFSGLWALARLPAALFILAIVASRGAALWYLRA